MIFCPFTFGYYRKRWALINVASIVEIEPHFQNKGFRIYTSFWIQICFFLPTGKSGQHFSSESDRTVQLWPYRKGRG